MQGLLLVELGLVILQVALLLAQHHHLASYRILLLQRLYIQLILAFLRLDVLLEPL